MSAIGRLLHGTRSGKYVSVGALGAIVDLSVSAAILGLGLLSPEPAKFVGAETAIVLMFFLNDRWTFAGFGETEIRKQLFRFVSSHVVRSVGLAIQITAVWYLTGLTDIWIAGIEVWSYASLAIAIVASFGVNYAAESLVTWRVIGTPHE